MDFEAAIFDLDGTLLDSMGIWDEVDNEFLSRRGLTVPPDYVDAVSYLSLRQAAEYTITRFGLPETPEQLVQEWHGLVAHRYATQVGLLPGAREYLHALKARGVRLAVATASAKEVVVPCLEHNGILELFETVCSADEVGCGKDSPQVFQLAARRLGVAPARCVVFDDVLTALRSAKQAGMQTCGVYEANSAKYRAEIERIADRYLLSLHDGPLPGGER